MQPAPILVVEDDEDIRRYAVAVLEDAGYDVLPARDAVEAFVQLEANPLADMARLRHPGLRVLYATGYFDTVQRQPGYRYGATLTKPYQRDELEAAVRQSLSEPPLLHAPGR